MARKFAAGKNFVVCALVSLKPSHRTLLTVAVGASGGVYMMTPKLQVQGVPAIIHSAMTDAKDKCQSQ